MARRKFVWVTCAVCKGTRIDGEEMVPVHQEGVFGMAGSTMWVKHDCECTNCGGDGGHRVPVLAPDYDADASPLNPSPKDPWSDPAYD